MGILPPGVKSAWSDNEVWVQAAILTYNQVRDYDEAKAAGLVDKPKSAPRPRGRKR